MKKLLLILAACSTVLFTAGKCANNPKPGNGDNDVDVVDPDTPTPAVELEMVYSNAYDGFLNIREKPDVKSPVIGKILNGPDGAIKMGEVKGWTVVKLGEIIGYASTRYLQSTPTPVFTDKDMEKCLLGIWMNNAPMNQRVFMLFEEGVFGGGYSNEGYVHAGTWSVKGDKLTLKLIKEDVDNDGMWEDLPIEKEEIYTITSGDEWGDKEEPFKRVKIMSDSDYEVTNEKLGCKWYEMTEEMWIQMYEGAHLHVKGSYPSGN